MRWTGMPMAMWVVFARSFQTQLTAVLGYDAVTARAITKKAKPQYRQIIRRLPEFEKADRFKMNLVNCRPESRRPQPLFVEHGLLRVSRRQRL